MLRPLHAINKILCLHFLGVHIKFITVFIGHAFIDIESALLTLRSWLIYRRHNCTIFTFISWKKVFILIITYNTKSRVLHKLIAAVHVRQKILIIITKIYKSLRSLRSYLKIVRNLSQVRYWNMFKVRNRNHQVYHMVVKLAQLSDPLQLI